MLVGLYESALNPRFMRYSFSDLLNALRHSPFCFFAVFGYLPDTLTGYGGRGASLLLDDNNFTQIM